MNGNLPDEETVLTVIIDYATRSFRNTADQDYISARMSYRAGLIEPFLWSGLHAIEKYLKAILLFNEKSSKGCKHDIEKLLRRVKAIEGLDLRLPESVESFITYLNRFGVNRYFEGAVLLKSHALDDLDETVWYIRRYCFYMNKSEYYDDRRISPSEQEQHPKSHNISGLLEDIINNIESKAYGYLVWENFFYGIQEEQCDRELIRKKQSGWLAINPTPAFFGKEAFDILDKYVDFSLAAKNHFK